MRRYYYSATFAQQHRFLFRLLLTVTLSVLFLLQMLSLSTRGVSAFTRSRATRTRISCTVVGRGTSAISTRHRSSRYYSPSFSPEQQDEPNFSGYSRPVVQWYPGHIAKAERQLQETIKAVDVVVEVRDARIPRATSHPLVAQWCAGRPRLVVLTHSDTVPEKSMTFWRNAYRKFGAEHPDQESKIDKHIRNQAAQAAAERVKYSPALNSNRKNYKKHTNQPHPQQYYSPNGKSSQNNDNNSIVAPIQDVIFVNAKEGRGIHSLTRAILKAGEHVQERRARRGLQGRPLRVGILGYPNVGKSALINRLLGRRRAKTANTPGVTRSLQWIRVRSDTDTSQKSDQSKRREFELLDSPGIIPAVLDDQSDAMLLAACNCIGDAAYDNQAVAAYLCEWILQIHRLKFEQQTVPSWRQKCRERYKLDPIAERDSFTGEDMLFRVADATCQGDPEDAARKILQDFRKGRVGPACLQVAPVETADQNPLHRAAAATLSADREDEMRRELEEERRARAVRAVETAKARGLELPPTMQQQQQRKQEMGEDNKPTDPKSVGKGQFDGW